MKTGMKATATVVLSALALGGITAPANADTAAQAQAKRASCGPNSVSQATSTFATYVYDVKTKRVPCGKAWKVIKAFHKCRKANGGSRGHCNSRVKGFKCKEGKRDNVVKGVRYRANVSCKRGSKKVRHEYEMAY